MKRAILIGMVAALLALTLAGAAGARGPSASGGDLDSIRTLELSFDGYCDGVTLTWDTITNIGVGVWTSRCASCPYQDVFLDKHGRTISYGVLIKGFTLASQTNYGSAPYFWSGIILGPGRTWTHYNFDGTVLNSGTWTPCGTQVHGGTTPSGSRQGQ